MCVKSKENLITILYDKKDTIRFFSESNQGLFYTINHSKDIKKIYDGSILEYDVDIEQNGSIGVLILDEQGNLIYFYCNKNNWSNHLLYKADQSSEQFMHISMKFNYNSPYITFCWRSLQEPSYWSIVAYYMDNGDWKKDVINRVYIKDQIKPYILNRGFDYTVYLVYLSNNNMIYDLYIKILPTQNKKWTEPFYLSNCIFVKYFFLDAVIERSKKVHISWIDKVKNNFCVKYISFGDLKQKLNKTESILVSKNPYLKQQLLIQNKDIVCFGVTNEYIHYSTGTASYRNSCKWTQQNTVFSSHAIHFVKVIQTLDSPHITYVATHILADTTIKPEPILMEEILSPNSEPTQEVFPLNLIGNNNVKKTINVHRKEQEIIIENMESQIKHIPDKDFKKIKEEFVKKNNVLHGKDRIINILEGKVSFLTEENKRLICLHNNYINLLHENSEKLKFYKEKANKIENTFNDKLIELEQMLVKNNELKSKMEEGQRELEKLDSIIKTIQSENIRLKQEIEESKNSSLIKKIFG